jgi:hypothetical protein
VNENIEARGFSKVSKETLGVYVGFEDRWDRALLGGRDKDVCKGVGGNDDLGVCGECPEGELGGEWCFSALRRGRWVCACSLSIVCWGFV